MSVSEREGEELGQICIIDDPVQEPLPHEGQIPRDEVHDADVKILPQTDN